MYRKGYTKTCNSRLMMNNLSHYVFKKKKKKKKREREKNNINLFEKLEQSIYEFKSKLLLINIRNIEKLKWSQ